MRFWTLVIVTLALGACFQVGVVYAPPSGEFEGEAPLCCAFMDAGVDGQDGDSEP